MMIPQYRCYYKRRLTNNHQTISSIVMMTFQSCGKRLLCHCRHGAFSASHYDQKCLMVVQQQQHQHQRKIPSYVAVLNDNMRSLCCLLRSTVNGDAVVSSSSSSWKNNDDSVMTIIKAKIISPRVIITRILQPPHPGRSSSSTSTMTHKRFFFASSTDHTTLLAQAEIHVLPVAKTAINADNNDNHAKTTTTTTTMQQQIVLAPHGMDLDMVRKVPQLHMARILLTTTTNKDNENENVVMMFHSAKVVNRTLGSIHHVCRRLLDYAVMTLPKNANSSSSSVKMFAKSTLHGLSEWVVTNVLVQKNHNNETIRMANDNDHNNSDNIADFVTSLSTKERQMIHAIAKDGDMTPFFHHNDDDSSEQHEHGSGQENGKSRSNRTATQLWEQLARMYLASSESSSSEAALYQSLGRDDSSGYGCRLVAIEQQADTSDYGKLAGGAMAVFSIELK